MFHSSLKTWGKKTFGQTNQPTHDTSSILFTEQIGFYTLQVTQYRVDSMYSEVQSTQHTL